jgi:hypothetical protein
MDYEAELDRLRNWRHDYVNPRLAAAVHLGEANAKAIDLLTTVVNGVDKRLDAMEDDVRIESEVKRRIKQRNKLELTIAQKVGGAAVVAMAVIDFVRGFIA